MNWFKSFFVNFPIFLLAQWWLENWQKRTSISIIDKALALFIHMIKVEVFWGGHKNLKKSPSRDRFLQILYPYQNKCTLGFWCQGIAQKFFRTFETSFETKMCMKCSRKVRYLIFFSLLFRWLLKTLPIFKNFPSTLLLMPIVECDNTNNVSLKANIRLWR